MTTAEAIREKNGIEVAVRRTASVRMQRTRGTGK